MKRRSFFKALAAFCVMPSLPVQRTWAKPLKLTTYWCQTKRHTFVYNDAYVKALQKAQIWMVIDKAWEDAKKCS